MTRESDRIVYRGLRTQDSDRKIGLLVGVESSARRLQDIRQEAPREDSLYSQLFNLGELVDYFRHAVLGFQAVRGSNEVNGTHPAPYTTMSLPAKSD